LYKFLPDFEPAVLASSKHPFRMGGVLHRAAIKPIQKGQHFEKLGRSIISFIHRCMAQQLARLGLGTTELPES
jgi:hypothetical protein